MNTIINLIEKTYYFLWGDWIHLPLPGGTTINLPLLVLLLVPTGIFCTIRTRFLQIRMLPDMLRALLEKAETGHKGGSLSALQALIVSTATRVGMGNLVGVVAAVSAGGAGAVFWMWIIALLGSSSAFVESTLAQLYKRKGKSEIASGEKLAEVISMEERFYLFDLPQTEQDYRKENGVDN